jgi:hypothetical protein
MGAESPVRPGRLSPRDPGVTGLVGEIWSGRRCTRMFRDHLPVGPHRLGLAPVFGSRSRVASSTGVQAFSEAHGGRGTIRTVTQSEQEFDHLQLASLISTRDTDHWLTDKQRLSILASGRPSTPLASLVTLVNPIPRGWLLNWNQTPPWNQAPVLTTSSSGSNYRTPEGHQIALPISKPVTPPLTTTTTTPQALVHSCSTPGVTHTSL